MAGRNTRLRGDGRGLQHQTKKMRWTSSELSLAHRLYISVQSSLAVKNPPLANLSTSSQTCQHPIHRTSIKPHSHKQNAVLHLPAIHQRSSPSAQPHLLHASALTPRTPAQHNSPSTSSLVAPFQHPDIRVLAKHN